MAYDAKNPLLFRVGEAKAVFATLSVPTGDTETVNSVTFTLLDDAGGTVINAATASHDGPGANVNCFYLLDSTSPVLGGGRYYYGYFLTNNTPSGSITTNVKPSVVIYVAPQLEATYIPGSDIGEIRALIGDTNPADAVWSDAEVLASVHRVGNYEIAAANLLQGAASDAARLAIIANNEGTTDATKLAQTLEDRAKNLRMNAITPGKVTLQADAAFTMGNTALGIVGSTDRWFS